MRIKIQKNGPYLVTGGVPLKEMIIRHKNGKNVYEEGRTFPLKDSYALCRCGHSKTAPFCDGAHLKNDFDGTETADRALYQDRLEGVVEGRDMLLLDDGRCAFARFCHTKNGSAWELVRKDTNPVFKKQALETAKMCPAGRLVIIDKNGEVLEEPNEPEIIILQDPQKGVSAGIYVKGNIVIESEDGTEYEPRNRVALCRCGQSNNKPFCDATHVTVVYRDAGE
jgi:CDGSH-type Zn-finger protein